MISIFFGFVFGSMAFWIVRSLFELMEKGVSTAAYAAHNERQTARQREIQSQESQVKHHQECFKTLQQFFPKNFPKSEFYEPQQYSDNLPAKFRELVLSLENEVSRIQDELNSDNENHPSLLPEVIHGYLYEQVKSVPIARGTQEENWFVKGPDNAILRDAIVKHAWFATVRVGAAGAHFEKFDDTLEYKIYERYSDFDACFYDAILVEPVAGGVRCSRGKVAIAKRTGEHNILLLRETTPYVVVGEYSFITSDKTISSLSEAKTKVIEQLRDEIKKKTKLLKKLQVFEDFKKYDAF